MTEYVKLNYGDWVETYKPIDNHFSPNVPGGQLFQIPCSDDERGFLQDVDVSRIWSYGPGEYGGMYIWSGEIARGFENYGAYVTEIGYTGETVIEVEFFEPEFDCPRCNEFWTSEDAITQQKKYEDACENCGTEEDLIHQTDYLLSMTLIEMEDK